MKVCDICQAQMSVYCEQRVTIDDKGNTKNLELCRFCDREFGRRMAKHKHLAYIETVKARAGKSTKRHWREKILEKFNNI